MIQLLYNFRTVCAKFRNIQMRHFIVNCSEMYVTGYWPAEPSGLFRSARLWLVGWLFRLASEPTLLLAQLACLKSLARLGSLGSLSRLGEQARLFANPACGYPTLP